VSNIVTCSVSDKLFLPATNSFSAKRKSHHRLWMMALSEKPLCLMAVSSDAS